MSKLLVALAAIFVCTLTYAEPGGQFPLPTIPTKASCKGHRTCLHDLPQIQIFMHGAFDELHAAYTTACSELPFVQSIVLDAHKLKVQNVLKQNCNSSSRPNVHSPKAMKKYKNDVRLVERMLSLGVMDEDLKTNLELVTPASEKLTLLIENIEMGLLGYRNSSEMFDVYNYR